MQKKILLHLCSLCRFKKKNACVFQMLQSHNDVLCMWTDAPVCVLACRCSSSLRVKRFPQNTQLHTNGRSPVCSRTWARSSDVFRKVFSQPGTWQMCFLFPTSPGLRSRRTNTYTQTQFYIPGWLKDVFCLPKSQYFNANTKKIIWSCKGSWKFYCYWPFSEVFMFWPIGGSMDQRHSS